MGLRRFWLRFAMPSESDLRILSLGCGVTAPDLQEALEMVRKRIFHCQALPPLIEVVEDVDVSTLDKGHILPNMGSPSNYGIWFPLGY